MEIGDYTMPKISLHQCFVVVYEGCYSSMGIPYEIFYEGEAEEDGIRAQATAQASIGTAFHHTVYALDDYIYAKTQDAIAEGERRASGSDY
jgi:hypothetical protein